MTNFLSIFNPIFNDAAQPWQLGFQDSAAPGFTGIVTLHNTVGFYLVLITFSVFWTLFSIIYYYNNKRNPIAHKYLTHGSTIELIWTITPALILIAIAFPSFKLLYLMDEVLSPTLTIKVVGLLGGLKLYILNKMRDTIKNGQKNNMYYRTIINKNRFNMNIRLCSFLAPQRFFKSSRPRIFYKNNSLSFLQNQQRYYHISNIRAINRIGPHNQDVLSVIIGSVLGDAYVNNRSGEGVRICYRQSIKHKEYLLWLYTFFYNRGYVSNLQPRQYSRTIKIKEGKVYLGYEFNTFTFRSLGWIHKTFYKNGKKVIPLNIYEYLTPLALAVWIMDDGGWTNYGIRIASNRFSLKEVELLNDVLKSKYNLETTIQKIWKENQYSIYIKKESVNNIRNIVGPYMHSSMLYKLGLDITCKSSFNTHTYI